MRGAEAMSQELVGRVDEVLALLPHITTSASANAEWDMRAGDFLRERGQQIRQALAGAEVAGDYECICHSCGEHFIGPKRSVTCADCATRPAPVRDGFVPVPVEPTEAMLTNAGCIRGYDNTSAETRGPDVDHIEWWKDMIAAAPAPGGGE